MSSYLTILRNSINEKLLRLEQELASSANGTLPHLFEAEPYPPFDDAETLPSQAVFVLVDKVRLDLHALDTLITPSRFKLVELGNLPYKVAALQTAVQLNVAEAIETRGGTVSLADLGSDLDVNEHKLGRILRMLAAEFVFQETSAGVFKNTRHSMALRAPGARSFLSFITDLGMRSATGISQDIISPKTKHSFAETDAPFCKKVSRDGQTFAEYMGDSKNAEMVELSGEGVVGWLNKLTRASLLNDYPWEDLGEATIIDLGAGAGDSGIDVMRKFQGFKWVYQDFAPVLDSLQKNYPEDLQQQVTDGRISFVVQDYFQPNESDGNVWYMRGVLHEYTDDQIRELLRHVATAMRRTPGSRMIINEVLNSSPAIVPAQANIGPPSDYVPATQSNLASTANTMTWSTFSLFGGKERSYQEYEALLLQAGLEVSKLYKFRTFTVMIECVLKAE